MSSHYSGYTPQHVLSSSLAWGPQQGSRAFIETKFHANHLEPVSDAQAFTATSYQSVTRNIGPGAHTVPQRRNNLNLLPMEKPFVAVPEYAAQYPDYLGEITALRDIEVATLESAFAQVDKNNEGFILPAEVRMVLRAAMGGKEPTKHTAAVFDGFFLRRNLTRIPLDVLLETVAHVIEYLAADIASEQPSNMKTFRQSTTIRAKNPYAQAAEAAATDAAIAASTAECSAAVSAHSDNASPTGQLGASVNFAGTSRGSESRRMLTAGPPGQADLHVPGLLAGAIREAQLNGEAVRRGLPQPCPKPGPPTVGTYRLLGPEPVSTHERDEGKYGEDPCARPVRETGVAGFYSTTKELTAGTTRLSSHVPGYMGHVPSYTVGVAAEQGLGQTKRDTFLGHTNLKDTYARRVPGYSGYLPDFAATCGASINKAHGVHSQTEQDRAAGIVESYWAAKKAAGVA